MTTPVIPTRKKSKKFLLLLVFLLLAGGAYLAYQRFFQEAAAPPAVVAQQYVREETVGDRSVTITVFAATPSRAEQAFAAAFARGREIEALVGDEPESELSKLNSGAQGKWRLLSPELFAMVSYGIELADLTDGAYDPARGALERLWESSLAAGQTPADDVFQRTAELSHWSQLELSIPTRSLRMENDVVELGLNGIGDGYALDEMMATLQGKGIQRALIVAGEEARASHPPTGQAGWRIRIKRPNRDRAEEISIANCGVSSLSIDLETRDIAGQARYPELSHQTGAELERKLFVTVVAPKCMAAQALAVAAKSSPTLIAGFSPSTDIHSRIFTADQAFLSSGFPPVTPWMEVSDSE